MFWADIEKQEKKERKRKLKWKRKHPKPSSLEEAEKNFDRLWYRRLNFLEAHSGGF